MSWVVLVVAVVAVVVEVVCRGSGVVRMVRRKIVDENVMVKSVEDDYYCVAVVSNVTGNSPVKNHVASFPKVTNQ